VKTAAIIVGTVTPAATVIAGTDAGRYLFRFVRLLPGQDLTGHFVLYGLLGLTVVGWVYQNQPTRHRTASATAVLAALIIAEECSQEFLRNRTFSLSDLAASLAGLATGVCCIWVLHMRRQEDSSDRQPPLMRHHKPPFPDCGFSSAVQA